MNGEDLARVVGNTMKFVNKKSLRLPDGVLFVLTKDRLTCYSCDDYISLLDSCETSQDFEQVVFVLSLEDCKSLEAWARENKKYAIFFREKVDDVMFELDGEEEPEASVSFKKARVTEENWEIVLMTLHTDSYKESAFHVSAISPARLTKISQLKTDKDVPMDIKVIEINGFQLLRFKIGRTIIGCIRTLDRSVIEPKLLWEQDAQISVTVTKIPEML